MSGGDEICRHQRKHVHLWRYCQDKSVPQQSVWYPGAYYIFDIAYPKSYSMLLVGIQSLVRCDPYKAKGETSKNFAFKPKVSSQTPDNPEKKYMNFVLPHELFIRYSMNLKLSNV